MNSKEYLQQLTHSVRIGVLMRYIEDECAKKAKEGQSFCQISFPKSGENSLQELLGGEWKEKYLSLRKRSYGSDDQDYESFLTELRNDVSRSIGLDVRDASCYERKRMCEHAWWVSW